MELHEENPFKIRSLNNAIFNLEKSPIALSTLTIDEIGKIEGVGKSIAAYIDDINREGKCAVLEEYKEKTPEGVIEMLDIKGVGPKKIRTIWKTLGVETIEDLLQACADDKIATLKGFGKKTQENIVEALRYKAANAGKLHYASALPLVEMLLKEIDTAFPHALISPTGDIRRKMEIIDQVALLVGTDNFLEVGDFLDTLATIEKSGTGSGPFTWRGSFKESGLPVIVRLCSKQDFHKLLMKHTGTTEHLNMPLENGGSLMKIINSNPLNSEDEAYSLAELPYIAPELREGLFEFEMVKEGKLPQRLIEMEDIKGILHNHSTYSDGKHSLEEMAIACRDLGYEYLGISDHSKTAFYANGLTEERVAEQQAEIDRLNEVLAPFKIFKGIESDILTTGELDYAPEVLQTFDFIVASIHTGFTNDIVKNTDRLLHAIQNPFTTILGHPTGRLLLRREGYPIDHKAVIDACATHNVIIEINANPWRLDLDWRWVYYALSKNVMLSINPDAHDKKEYDYMHYGVAVGRKGGLTKERTLNCLSREEVENIFKLKKGAAVAP